MTGPLAYYQSFEEEAEGRIKAVYKGVAKNLPVWIAESSGTDILNLLAPVNDSVLERIREQRAKLFGDQGCLVEYWTHKNGARYRVLGLAVYRPRNIICVVYEVAESPGQIYLRPCEGKDAFFDEDRFQPVIETDE